MQTHPATQHPDLFPETLLVSRQGERIYTTSRRVACYFGKKHHNVLRAVKNVMVEMVDDAANEIKIDFIDTLNDGSDTPKTGSISTAKFPDFELSHYRDGRNRKKPEYFLSHDGFLFLVMGFTGREAMRWKKVFVREFRRMEAELASRQTIRVTALDILHPNLLPTVEDFERGLPRMATAQRIERSVASVTYYRRKARGLGLIPVHAARGQA